MKLLITLGPSTVEDEKLVANVAQAAAVIAGVPNCSVISVPENCTVTSAKTTPSLGVKELRTDFRIMVNAKTGWGKEELKKKFDDLLFDKIKYEVTK
jgi:hypothetical protein